MSATPQQNEVARLEELLATRPNRDAMARFFLAIILATAAAGANGLEGLVVVDATLGDDATGQRNGFASFKTLTAGLAVMQNGDFMWIAPGTYTGTFTVPQLSAMSILGLSPTSGDIRIVGNDAGPVLRIGTTAGGAGMTGLTLENFTVVNGGAGRGLSVGNATTTHFDDTDLPLVLRNVFIDKGEFVNLGRVTMEESVYSTELVESGVGWATHDACEITGYIMHYLDLVSTTQPTATGRKGTYFYGCFCQTTFVLSGAVSVEIDAATIIGCLLDASGLSSNVLNVLDPWLRCAALIGSGAATQRANFTVAAATLLNITFANVAWQSVGADAAGFDLTGCRVYGDLAITFGFDLNLVVLDKTIFQFNAVGASFFGDITVTQTPVLAGANRYFVTLRNSQLGVPGQVGVQASTPTVTADRCDIDIRGSSRNNVVLAVNNGGTIDRDSIVVPSLALVAATPFTLGAGLFATEPPFPAGVTYSIELTATVATPAVGDIPFDTIAAHASNGFTLTGTAATVAVGFLLTRGPN